LIPQGVGKFQIQCWINQNFDVQCSADLSTWTSVTTVTNETGTLIFEDAEAGQHDCRYYRVVVPPIGSDLTPLAFRTRSSNEAD
jgi:hypothetical protein